MSGSVSEVTKRRQRCVELVSIGARRKGCEEIGNLDRLLVQVREEICPESEQYPGPVLPAIGGALRAILRSSSPVRR